MSFFIVICPNCGERYMHMFVGTQLLSGHDCKKPPRDVSPFGWKKGPSS